jgi:hypothetical protein
MMHQSIKVEKLKFTPAYAVPTNYNCLAATLNLAVCEFDSRMSDLYIELNGKSLEALPKQISAARLELNHMINGGNVLRYTSDGAVKQNWPNQARLLGTFLCEFDASLREFEKATNIAYEEGANANSNLFGTGIPDVFENVYDLGRQIFAWAEEWANVVADRNGRPIETPRERQRRTLKELGVRI